MEAIDDRSPRTIVLGGAVGVAAVACFVAALYEAYVPGRVYEVVGSVVTRDVFIGDETSPRYFVHVRLDDGRTVRARTDSSVAPMPGDRVVLMKIETPLLRWHRYRYERHVDSQPNVAAPVERVTR